MTTEKVTGARRERRIDWRLAANLLAEGATAAAVARQLGCSASHVARKRRADATLKRWIEEARSSPSPTVPATPIPATTAVPETPRASTPRPRLDRIDDLRHALHDAIEAEVRNGNVRVILWLADRLNLVQPPSERTPEEELRDILGGLGPDELREFEGLRDDPRAAGQPVLGAESPVSPDSTKSSPSSK